MGKLTIELMKQPDGWLVDVTLDRPWHRYAAWGPFRTRTEALSGIHRLGRSVDLTQSTPKGWTMEELNHHLGNCGPECPRCQAVDLAHLVGLPVAEAIARLGSDADVRQIQEEGRAITCDWKPERITLSLSDGRVTLVRRG